MSREDDPRAVLGEDLWELLGRASEPAERQHDAPWSVLTEETREALGEDLWELLGHASESPQRAVPLPAPVIPPPLPWRALALSLLAAAVPFLVIPWLRDEPAPQADSDDLALVRELDLAENLDLLSHPDFEVLVRWDGRTP